MLSDQFYHIGGVGLAKFGELIADGGGSGRGYHFERVENLRDGKPGYIAKREIVSD